MSVNNMSTFYWHFTAFSDIMWFIYRTAVAAGVQPGRHGTLDPAWYDWQLSRTIAVVIHASHIAAGVGRAFSCICLFVCLSVRLFVRAVKGKRLELSAPNLVHMYSIVVAWHALTNRSKGQRSRSHGYENRHGRTVASDACCYDHVLLLPAWVCMSIRLPMFPSCELRSVNSHVTNWNTTTMLKSLRLSIIVLHLCRTWKAISRDVTASCYSSETWAVSEVDVVRCVLIISVVLPVWAVHLSWLVVNVWIDWHQMHKSRCCMDVMA